jgi:hypothetical protein
MPLLAYCLSESHPVVVPQRGVAEFPVETLEQGGIRCFFSRSNNRDQILGPPARETALAFYEVINSIFRQLAVIPFRFPTILEDQTKLRDYLLERESTYREVLLRLRNLVQLELHLLSKSSSLERGDGSRTGSEYLRARQAEQCELADLSVALRQSARSFLREWRERPSAHSLRCFALIERNVIDDFKKAILATRVPEELSVRVSGPWPASEFISES